MTRQSNLDDLPANPPCQATSSSRNHTPPRPSVSDNAKVIVLTIVIAFAIAIMAIASYWAETKRAPIAACERLEDQQLIAECLAGIAP